MNDQDLERVLKSAGPRERPPAGIEREVRELLHGEWREVVAERRRRFRQRSVFAVAAAVVGAAVGVTFLVPRLAPAPAAIATVALASGDVRADSGWLHAERQVASGQPVLEGQAVETGSTGRAAFRLTGGISARLDRDSRIVVAAADRVVLERGTIYVDSGPAGSAGAPLDVVTPNGIVRHVGTRYEVRLLDDAVQLSVRDGAIEWHASSGGVARSGAGERMTIRDDGRIERSTLSPFSGDWEWTLAATPAIDIEGMPLSRFLAWAAHETGREVAYASPAVEREAAGIVVHGSIEGLTPPEALDAVLATTSVQAQAAGASLVVDNR